VHLGEAKAGSFEIRELKKGFKVERVPIWSVKSMGIRRKAYRECLDDDVDES